MRIEVAGGIGADFERERERFVFTFDAAYLRLSLLAYYHDTRASDDAPWEEVRKPNPDLLPTWVIVEARVNLAQRIDVTT